MVVENVKFDGNGVYIDETTKTFYERIRLKHQHPMPGRIAMPYTRENELMDAVLKLIQRFIM
jgi:hypothetical protein